MGQGDESRQGSASLRFGSEASPTGAFSSQFLCACDVPYVAFEVFLKLLAFPQISPNNPTNRNLKLFFSMMMSLTDMTDISLQKYSYLKSHPAFLI